MDPTPRDRLEKYKPLAEFLSQCYGNNVEVVLHDISDLDHSAVAIFNSHVSGRVIGAPMTYYGLKIIRDKLYKNMDYSVNTKNVLANGKTLRSSTFFLKDDDGELIGTLCINVDVSQYVALGKLLENMTFGAILQEDIGPAEPSEQTAQASPDHTVTLKETFPTTVDDLIEATILESIGEKGAISDLTPERKIDLVSKLNEKGIFMFKGTVKKVSVALGVSEPTVYRYLSAVTQGN